MKGEYFSYLLVPFKYRGDFNQTADSLGAEKEGGLSYWREESLKTQRFYEHIDRLIACDDCDSKEIKNLGRKFRLKENEGRAYLRKQTLKKQDFMGVMGRKNERYTYCSKKITFDFDIEAVELYLFQTQIGFLVYKITYPDGENRGSRKNRTYDEGDIRELVEKIYYLKKLYNGQKNIQLSLKTSKDTQKTFDLNLSELSEGLLSFAEMTVETYFESSNRHPHQALVYTGVSLEEPWEEEEALENLFYLRRSFKKSYLISKEETRTISEEVYKPFENIYWGVSMEGLAGIAYKSDQSPFSTEGFLNRCEGSYFYLYILALHQRYALINFSIEASKLGQNHRNKLEALKDLKEKLLNFHLQWMFKHLSNITHYTVLYEKMKASLRIEEALEELNSEIHLLSEMEQLRKEEILYEKEEAMDKLEKSFHRNVALITGVFVVLQTSAAIISILEVELLTSVAAETRLWIYIVLQTLIILGFSGLVMRAFKDKRKQKKT